MRVGRNDPCPCGSKKKYKQCCEKKARSSRGSTALMVVVGAIVIGGLAAAFSSWNDDSVPASTPGRVWSPEHGHYH
jgi:SEC-C motif